MTIILRTGLLPLSLVNEYNKLKNEALYKEIKELEKVYQNDQIVKNQEIRKVLKMRRVQPWAKVVVIGIQALVLVLLYQVFLRGITGEKILRILYPSVYFPGMINTNFYGFELGMRHDIIWSGMIGLFLLGEIYMQYRRFKGGIEKKDLAYFILFPIFVFFLLWLLPMVKSLFIFTSLLYSLIVGGVARIFFESAIKKMVIIPKKEEIQTEHK